MVNSFSQCTETIKRIHTGVLWPYNVALYCCKCATKTGISKVMSYDTPKMLSSKFWSPNIKIKDILWNMYVCVHVGKNCILRAWRFGLAKHLK